MPKYQNKKSKLSKLLNKEKLVIFIPLMNQVKITSI